MVLNWKDLKIRTKLFFGFLSFFIFFFILQLVVQLKYTKFQRDSEAITKIETEADDLNIDLNIQNQNLFFGLGKLTAVDAKDQLISARMAIQTNQVSIDQFISNMEKVEANNQVVSMLNDISRSMAEVDQSIGVLLNTYDLDHKVDSATLSDLYSKLSSLSTKTIEISKLNSTLAMSYQKSMIEDIEDEKLAMYFIGSIGIFIVGLFFYIIGISIRNFARKVIRFTKHLENGELWVEPTLTSRDEFGLISEAINNVRLKTREVLLSIDESTKGMLAASHEFSSGSSIISSGASEQAAASAEISSTMDVVAEGIKHASKKAVETSVIAQKAYLEIEGGVKKVSEAAGVIEIIANKNKIIGEISYQTKILSINASVEAARASEYGRGFAVVAEEVKKLAEDTQFSATEISEVSKRGVNLSNESAAMLNAIVPHIKETAALIDSIGQMGTEHIVGIEQISRSIQELNNVIQQNAASSEELASSSEELVRTVESLRDQVSFFKFEKSESEETIEEVVEIGDENNGLIDFDQDNDSSSFQNWGDEPEKEIETTELDDNFESWLKKRKNDSETTSKPAFKFRAAKKHQETTFSADESDEMINIRPFADADTEESIKYPVVDEQKIDLSTLTKPETESKKVIKKAKPFSNQDKSGVRINLSDNDDFDSQFERIK